MPVINGWEYPHVRVEPPNERRLKLLASPEVNGYEVASVMFSHVPPGSTTGPHTHAESDEIMHFVGRGLAIMEGVETPLETDSVAIAPKGVPHEVRNTSETETLKIFCVFVPPVKPTSPVVAELTRRTKEYLRSKGGQG